MATTISDRWHGLKQRFTVLRGLMRRTHRLTGTLWLLSLALTLFVDTSEIPGPSIPALLFIALLITGGSLLIWPWVRPSSSVSDRLNALTRWTWTPSVVIRRTHRIAGGLFLLSLVAALVITATVGAAEEVTLIPLVVLLLYLAITGLYMFFQPWVTRLRAG